MHAASTTADPPPPDAAAVLRFLGSPPAHAAHAGTAVAVEVVETHMSWVFLAGPHVLKLKKAVRHPFLDFSTLARRAFYCREEVRLNRRLAPDVYLGLMALQWQDGRLSLVPEADRVPTARTIDWLVWMRRLPAERMLDRAIAEGRVTDGDVDALLEVLVRFYAAAPRVPLGGAGYRAQFERQLASDRAVLSGAPPGRLPEAAPVLDALAGALRRWAPLLDARAEAGKVVDGHGDLRPEHVALLTPPVVIDCLEFSPVLRQLDPFDELAFLGMECALAGAPWIGPRLVDGAMQALGDRPPARLLHLYTASRALLRARLAMAHLLDDPPRDPARWVPLARRCVARAQAALDAAADDAPYGGGVPDTASGGRSPEGGDPAAPAARG